MAKIRLEHLKPGMLLAQDASTLKGNVIVSKGTKLTASHIKVLKTWGIPEAAVENEGVPFPDAEATASVDPQQRAAAEKEIDLRFAVSNQDHPAIQELRRLALDSLLRQGETVE
ncbi:MAG: hypothetical protein ACE5EK_07455 [Nitrospinales bacterium]